MVVLPTGVDEAANPDKMEALYASVRSWGTEEEYTIPFPDQKGVGEYWDHLDTNLLSANLVAVFLDMTSLLNSHVEITVIQNYITQDNNKLMEDESNKTAKFNGCIVLWENPSLHFIVWLRRINKMVDLIESAP